jgi:ribosomal protein S18 acetylase RimI-like enzyme
MTIYGICHSDTYEFKCAAFDAATNVLLGKMAGSFIGKGQATINSLNVIKNRRGEGVGRTLVDVLHNDLEADAGKQNVCTYASALEDAVGFYEKVGFRKAACMTLDYLFI